MPRRHPSGESSADAGRSSAGEIAERAGLVARIRQVRRVASAAKSPDRRPATGPEPDGEKGELAGLEVRVAHLERLVEGLQDSVHREFDRHGKMIAQLQAQVQPAAMGTALAEDARNRGL